MNERIPPDIHNSWMPYLQPLFNDPKMIRIRDEILPNCKFRPSKENIFRVFKKPLNEIKVVILGQDPYADNSAIGYSFAVSKTTPIPKSLQIIRNEITNSQVERDKTVNIDSADWRELKHWRNQGVFLLNTALTVEWKNPDSHTGYWNWFSRKVIQTIAEHQAPTWLLWGSNAKGFESTIKESEKLSGKYINPILKAYHPAAESRPDSKYIFSGCNHFNLCNKILRESGRNVINW